VGFRLGWRVKGWWEGPLLRWRGEEGGEVWRGSFILPGNKKCKLSLSQALGLSAAAEVFGLLICVFLSPVTKHESKRNHNKHYILPLKIIGCFINIFKNCLKEK